MHWTTNIFGPSATSTGGIWVSLNYPILNFKRTVCQKMSGCGTVTPCKAEEKLQGMELPEKEAQKY